MDTFSLFPTVRLLLSLSTVDDRALFNAERLLVEGLLMAHSVPSAGDFATLKSETFRVGTVVPHSSLAPRGTAEGVDEMEWARE
jgi:hypothetical protein